MTLLDLAILGGVLLVIAAVAAAACPRRRPGPEPDEEGSDAEQLPTLTVHEEEERFRWRPYDWTQEGL